MTGAERGEKWKVNNGGGRQHIDGRWSTRTVPPYYSSFTYEYSTITRRGTAPLHRSMLTQVGDVAVIQDHFDVRGVKLRLGKVRKVEKLLLSAMEILFRTEKCSVQETYSVPPRPIRLRLI